MHFIVTQAEAPLVCYTKHIKHELHALFGAGKLEGTEEEVDESILDETV